MRLLFLFHAQDSTSNVALEKHKVREASQRPQNAAGLWGFTNARNATTTKIVVTEVGAIYQKPAQPSSRTLPYKPLQCTSEGGPMPPPSSTMSSRPQPKLKRPCSRTQAPRYLKRMLLLGRRGWGAHAALLNVASRIAHECWTV